GGGGGLWAAGGGQAVAERGEREPTDRGDARAGALADQDLAVAQRDSVGVGARAGVEEDRVPVLRAGGGATVDGLEGRECREWLREAPAVGSERGADRGAGLDEPDHVADRDRDVAD